MENDQEKSALINVSWSNTETGSRRLKNYGSSPPPSSPNQIPVKGADGMYFDCDLLQSNEANDASNALVLSSIPAPVAEQRQEGAPDDDAASSESSSNAFSHCHANDADDVGNHKARRTLVIASCLCLSFMLAEVVGGYIAGSLAIMTDAAHLLTDFASFLISLFSLYVASRPATRRMSFGWHRAEVLGAFISVLLIWIITGVLVYVAVERIVNKTYDVKAVPMLITAAVGVFVNVLLGMLLHQSGHQHSHGGGLGHGHSHGSNSSPSKAKAASAMNGCRHDADDDSLLLNDDNVDVEGGVAGEDACFADSKKNSTAPHRPKPKKGEQNLNVRAAFIHVLGDFFQSIGVLIAAYVIYFHPELSVIDPICTFIFSALVLLTTLAIMRDALNVLMEGSPRGIEFLHVADSLAQIRGVVRVHNLRIWSLTMDKVALSVHLAVDGQSADSQNVLKAATQMLRRRFGVYECTVQIEHYTDDMDECTKCEHPKT